VPTVPTKYSTACYVTQLPEIHSCHVTLLTGSEDYCHMQIFDKEVSSSILNLSSRNFVDCWIEVADHHLDLGI
jgi:hypothetical protein